MKSAAFYCPYDSVFKVVQTILKRKRYIIFSLDHNEGLIRAHSMKNIFERPKTLDLRVFRINQHATGIKLMINNNARVFDRPISYIEREEERLNDTINRYF